MPRFILPSLCSLLATLLTAATASAAVDNDTACTSLTSLSLGPNTQINFAVSIPANSSFTPSTAESSYNNPQHNLPAACRVSFTVITSHDNTANTTSTATAELWLPHPSTWEGRYLTVGNSGFAGAINYPDLLFGLLKNFASMSTDTGHTSSQADGSWLSCPSAAVDWGHRALHLTTLSAKYITAAYYGVTEMRGSYYAGCSTGGRQGLNAAQRYPKDFDGVLVGSAIPWQTHTSAWQTWVALWQFPSNRSSYIPASKWAGIAAAVLERCDGLDGVVDGVVMDPARCDFRPSGLMCGMEGVSEESCLTGAQVRNLERIYAGWFTEDGEVVNPGTAKSGEASFGSLMNGDEPDFGDFYRYAVLNDSEWDWRQMSVSTVELADSINPGGSNAYNPDMRPFQDAGGKLIQYHGYADPLIPTYSAPAWYDKLVSYYSDIGRGGEVEEFYRLFTVPGMGHCSGGVGAWVLDGASQGGVVPTSDDTDHSMLWSLVEWVEGKNGSAPESVVGTKFVNDTASLGVSFERPVCRWPNAAKYVGGDANLAASWECPTEGVY